MSEGRNPTSSTCLSHLRRKIVFGKPTHWHRFRGRGRVSATDKKRDPASRIRKSFPPAIPFAALHQYKKRTVNVVPFHSLHDLSLVFLRERKSNLTAEIRVPVPTLWLSTETESLLGLPVRLRNPSPSERARGTPRGCRPFPFEIGKILRAAKAKAFERDDSGFQRS